MAECIHLRSFLYVALTLFSIVLMGLTGARIHYTTHLPRGDPLNNGVNFYDPIVAELLVCAIIGIIWSPLMLYIIHAQREYRALSKGWQELVLLSILWLMLLVGAAFSTHIWPNLPSFCSMYIACRVLTAMLAFAWLSWITVSGLLIEAFVYGMTNSRVHGQGGFWEGHHEDGYANRRMSEASRYSAHERAT